MAGIAGLDVNAIVSNFMISENKPLDRMKSKYTNNKTQLGGYDQLSSLINTLKTNVSALTTAISSGMTTSVSDDTKLSATITNNQLVYTSSHTVNVTTLAKAEVLGSATPEISRDAALGYSGTLTMTIGSSNFSITVNTSDTLNTIRDKINNTSANIGVTASILATNNEISGDDEFSLVIASDNTGVDNKVTLSGTAAASLDISDELSAATDASFTFDSQTVVRSSNTITDVMDGLSFHLLDTGSSSLTISLNEDTQNSNVKTSLQSVVDNYNQVVTFLDTVTAERTMTDSQILNIKTSLKNIFSSNEVSDGTIASLFDMGVTYGPSKTMTTNKGIGFTSTGYLKIDDTALTNALNNNRGDIKTFITNTSDGFVKSANDIFENINGYDGIIKVRQSTLSNNNLRINNEMDLEQERLDKVKLDLVAKYSKLNSLLNKFDQMSTFLDAQLASLTGGKK
jgi:flagellar hook-associated protein 2